METKLLSRLNRAITCVNAYDSDKTFNRKLMEVRLYAQFMNKGDSLLEEIIRIADDALSREKHPKSEKKEIKEKLHSIQKKIQEKVKEELFDCLSL